MEDYMTGMWQQDLADFLEGLNDAQRARLEAIIGQYEPDAGASGL
jgi:hypothetical protein